MHQATGSCFFYQDVLDLTMEERELYIDGLIFTFGGDDMKTKDLIVLFIYRLFHTAIWLTFISYLISKSGSYKPLWLLIVYVLTQLSIESKEDK